ncbi:MAG: nucleoside recognition domain-containing protein [Myxococcaceae bacterium]
MLNWIFAVLVLGAVATASLTGTMGAVTKASMDSAKSSVDLAITLAGQMTLWLGFMGILREAGLMHSLAKRLNPVMRRLFPDVPPDHPAMGAMVLNLAANMLGVGNAATPFGLKAMAELDSLNSRKGVATNAMALFLAINTSGVAVLALGVVAVRASLGSNDAAGILLPSLLATSCSTAAAIVVAKMTERLPMFAPTRYPAAHLPLEAGSKPISGMAQAEQAAAERVVKVGAERFLAWGVLAVLGLATVRYLVSLPSGPERALTLRAMMSDWLLPLLMCGIVLFGLSRGVKVYETFIASAKEGFQTAIQIIPFLVAILVAIGMFRASGAMEAIVTVLGPLTTRLGFPAEALPMALIRPMSGSGALAVMTEAMKTHGPDSFVGYLVSVLNGSMETTFYVLAVYFGSIGIRATRHTLVACLAADIAGVVGAVTVCHLFFG